MFVSLQYTKSEEVAAFDRDVQNCKIRGKEEVSFCVISTSFYVNLLRQSYGLLVYPMNQKCTFANSLI